MSEDFDFFKKDLQDYFQVQFDLIRLHTAENISRIFSKAANAAIMGYLMSFILLFLSVAAGFYLSSRFNSDVTGFLFIGAFYFLVLIIFLIFRKQIVDRPIIKAIIKLLFPKNDYERK